MKIQEAIDKLKRKNGTLNTRFLSEKYISEFGLKEEAKVLLDNNIRNPQDIYDYENSTNDNCPGLPDGTKCPDSAKRRFINYKNGYVPQCKRCGNWRNQEKALDLRFDKTNPKHVLEKYNIDILKIKDSDPKYHSYFISTIKENILLNTDGKIEGQRIDRSYFDNRGLLEAYLLLEKYGITSAEGLYRYETNDSGLCECGNNKRFISYNEGYKQYCESCGRSKNNHMVHKEGSVDLELHEVLDYVASVESGKYSSAKILELSKNTINKIIKRTDYIINGSISERLYHIENSLFDQQYCLNCSKNPRVFISSIAGYRDSCSTKCGYELVNYDERNLLRRKTLYDYQVNKLSDLSNLGLDEQYSVELFTLDEYIHNNNPEILFKHSCGHEYQRNMNYQGAWHCPKCFSSKSNEQYEIYDFIKSLIPDEEVLYDDRKTLNGLELDIYIPGRNLAIEYNGAAFHSFGKSSYSPLNNFNDESTKKKNHLTKTEMCEDLGIKLLHIFSTDNQEIWKDMILNYLGFSKRIYARKCIIKEVQNKEAKEFLDLNHLQGSINSSIKLGLYYNSELVSIMTFAKSRYTKTTQYELMRFCSLRKHNVIGAASRLLKHFERIYSPKSLVSYANRRWSSTLGNVYDSLGFSLSHISGINYFYFKLNENIIHSRVKFQKHKLPKILNVFDNKLSETENMYNNEYRKIYDSGNLVYIKKYK